MIDLDMLVVVFVDFLYVDVLWLCVLDVFGVGCWDGCLYL